MSETLLYKPEAAAAVLGIGRNKVFELIATGDLKSVKIGRARRISRDALEEFVTQLGSTTQSVA